jgi:hypothetical protein
VPGVPALGAAGCRAGAVDIGGRHQLACAERAQACVVGVGIARRRLRCSETGARLRDLFAACTGFQFAQRFTLALRFGVGGPGLRLGPGAFQREQFRARRDLLAFAYVNGHDALGGRRRQGDAVVLQRTQRLRRLGGACGDQKHPAGRGDPVKRSSHGADSLSCSPLSSSAKV